MRTLLLSFLISALTLQFAGAQNHPPVATVDTVDGISQVPMIIDVLANDYDPDGDSIFISNVISHTGDAIIQDGKIWFNPDPFTGLHFFRYTISDGQLTSTAYTEVYVSINPDAPLAVADTFDFVELTTHTLDILENDSDPNGDVFKIFNISSKDYCSVTVNPDSLSVTISLSSGKKASFKYTTRDTSNDNLVSDEAIVSIYMTPNPDRPIALSDTMYATGGFTVDLPVLSNDSDPQGEAIELNSVGLVEHGTIEIIEGVLRYTPELSFKGHESTYYTIREVNDSTMYSLYAPIEIIVEKNPHCPVGLPDTASGMSALPIIIDVLANDFDPDGDLIEVSGATVTPDNKLMYTSMSFETGYDSISYIVSEKNNPLSYSEPVKVKIKLQPNPAYPWGVNDSVTMIAGSTIVIHPLENDIHNGFDSLVIKAVTILNNDYSGLVENTDHTITYTAPYQANGVQRIQYIMAPVDSGYSYMGRGEILLNIIGVPYYDSLTINNINAGVGADGTLFSMVYRFEDGHYWGAYHQHFKVPANQPASTIFSNTFIVGGYNQNNNLHIARKWEDWKTGPVSAVYDDEYDSRYLRLWKLTREEIEYHKQNYQAPNYQSSEAITNWPGNGRWNSGEALHLAPFYDVNGDDNYIPADGDYPLIRGDECIFFMCNDNTLRTDTLGQPLNAELHGMVYAFNNPDDTALNNTIFVHYDIFNRSQNNYTNCYASVFNDFDIGGGTNDYYRTDVGRSSIIGYNGEDYDWANEQYAYTGNPPAQSITVLAGPFMDPDNNDNPSGECDESVNGINFNNGIPDDERVGLSSALSYQTMEHSIFGQDYVDATEWYNFMKAIWDDETHVLYGGNGHISNGGNGTNARYMFPGDSDPLNYGTNCQLPGNGFNQGTKFWTEEQARNNYGDRRGLTSMGPFSLAPGQAQEIDLAYCAGLGNNGAMSSVNQLLRNIDSLRNAVAQGRIVIPNNSLGIAPKNLQTTLSLYPNPATDVIVVANHFSDTKAEYSIFNILGVKVSEGYLIGERPTINISNLNHGIFVIKVTDGITVSNGKFIKQ